MRAITSTFEKLRGVERGAFIPFITAGDPDLGTTIRLVPELERAGCDIIELGVPFSDPLADGPVIQRASERALRHGCSLGDILGAMHSIRASSAVPVVLFSYYNPIYRYGLERFARDAQAAGVDGVLVTDMIPEESAEYRACMEDYGLDTVFLVAPTSSPGRISRICECTRGFVYVVSRTGVTGVSDSLSDSIAPMLGRVRQQTSLPVAVGFGISRPEHVRAVWRIADGAVVGSALVRQMESAGQRGDPVGAAVDFCRWLTGEVVQA